MNLSSPPIPHTAFIDRNGVVLAAEIIGFLLQRGISTENESFLIDLICAFYRGKGEDKPAITNINEAVSLITRYKEIKEREKKGKPLHKNSKILKILNVYKKVSQLSFIGDPGRDWMLVQSTLEEAECNRLRQIAKESKNLRLLNRGALLRDSLLENWREYGRYRDAHEIIRNAFSREYLSTAYKPEEGVTIMNNAQS